MIDDQDLEARLAAYRPAGPPADLRARLGEARTDAGRAKSDARAKAGALAWLPAVAAMLLAATLYWLAAAGRERIFAQLPPAGAAQTVDLNREAQP
jgi:hypothetical protein